MNDSKKIAIIPARQDIYDAAKAIAGVLSETPMTAAEIDAALGTDYAALQVSNAVSFLPGAASCKVTRTVVNRRGETVEKTYAAYYYEKPAGTAEDR